MNFLERWDVAQGTLRFGGDMVHDPNPGFLGPDFLNGCE